MIPWGGVSCCLGAAALYLFGRNNGRDAEALMSVTRVNKLKELDQLLEKDCNFMPLIVAVSGRVGSEAPIDSEYSGLRGVIVEETAEQHFLKHNDTSPWIQDSALMLSMSKEVPWYLEDETSRVHIVGARGASGFVLAVGSEVFEEAGRSLEHKNMDYLQGIKMLGVKRVERVLTVGSSLNAIGEAVRDDVGTVRIQRPEKGPFYVSQKSFDQLILDLGKWARWYKCASMSMSAFGLYLIAKHIVQTIMDRRRLQEFRKRVFEAAAKTLSQEDEDAAKRDRPMPQICVVCLENEYNSVFVPCGHMCCCIVCSSHLASCPLCRRRIDQVIKTFRH